jgi:hypothetical protein
VIIVGALILKLGGGGGEELNAYFLFNSFVWLWLFAVEDELDSLLFRRLFASGESRSSSLEENELRGDVRVGEILEAIIVLSFELFELVTMRRLYCSMLIADCFTCLISLASN